jgi:aldehyde dehydrogenase (NAD+)
MAKADTKSSNPAVAITVNPAHPSEIVSEVPASQWSDVDSAVNRLAVAQPEWRAIARLRADALMGWADSIVREADDLAILVSREVGKPISESRAEVARSVAILRYYAQAAYDPAGQMLPSPDGVSTLRTERLPLGTILAITPFNFPIAIPVWKIAPALAYGNTVILKPSTAAVGCALRLVELASHSVPAEALAVAVGSGELVSRLVGHDRVSGVSFTGSRSVGYQLLSRTATRGLPLQAEMGGQNPSIILRDADIAGAAQTVASAGMAYAGQKCTATSRVIVDRSVASRFIDAFTAAVESLCVGEPLEETTLIGPLISEAARDRMLVAVGGAVKRGAIPLSGAARVNSEGWFAVPTVLQVADPADPFAQEETFGPAISIIIADGEDRIVELANATKYGLVAALYSEDTDRATTLARRVEVGMIRINASTTGVDYYAPFGGERMSSYGPREQGRAAREFYTRTRTVLITPARRDPPSDRPPVLQGRSNVAR